VSSKRVISLSAIRNTAVLLRNSVNPMADVVDKCLRSGIGIAAGRRFEESHQLKTRLSGLIGSY